MSGKSSKTTAFAWLQGSTMLCGIQNMRDHTGQTREDVHLTVQILDAVTGAQLASETVPHVSNGLYFKAIDLTAPPRHLKATLVGSVTGLGQRTWTPDIVVLPDKD
ncbi:MAG TPA: hypothetical protein VKZ85_16155 [Woeseiaceae bacterium]|nr:hypothetical protein [Woeseiaceae bacterium]